MHKYLIKAVCLLCFMMLLHAGVKAQVYDTIPGQQYEYDRQGRPIKKDSTSQNLKHRDVYEDSITVYYRYWDSSRTNKLDSSINAVSYTHLRAHETGRKLACRHLLEKKKKK